MASLPFKDHEDEWVKKLKENILWSRPLLHITLLIMLAPARLLFVPLLWSEWLIASQVTIWMMVLIFQVLRARAEKTCFHGGCPNPDSERWGGISKTFEFAEREGGT